MTCLYSADRVAEVTGVPHSLQNLAVGLNCAPQEPQENAVAVSPPLPSPLGSTSVSFHCWSAMSVVSLCHLRHEGLRPSYVVSFETAAHLARLSPEHRVIVSYRRGKTKKTRIAPGLLDRGLPGIYFAGDTVAVAIEAGGLIAVIAFVERCHSCIPCCGAVFVVRIGTGRPSSQHRAGKQRAADDSGDHLLLHCVLFLPGPL